MEKKRLPTNGNSEHKDSAEKSSASPQKKRSAPEETLASSPQRKKAESADTSFDSPQFKIPESVGASSASPHFKKPESIEKSSASPQFKKPKPVLTLSGSPWFKLPDVAGTPPSSPLKKKASSPGESSASPQKKKRTGKLEKEVSVTSTSSGVSVSTAESKTSTSPLSSESIPSASSGVYDELSKSSTAGPEPETIDPNLKISLLELSKTFQTTGTRYEASYFRTPNNVQMNCDEVFEDLFIGDEIAALDLEYLKSNGITHIVNMAAAEVKTTESYYNNLGIVYMGVATVSDRPKQQISLHFDTVSEFIDEGLKEGKVLVHCLMGSSRSTATVLAYLIKYKKMDPYEACKLVKGKHVCRPNDGFLQQLADYSNKLLFGAAH